jgi:uncharacterized protein (DUF58 family)
MKTVIGVATLALAAGLIPAYIARHKGWPFVAWWIYGALLFIVAFPHSIFLELNPDKGLAREE